MHPVETVLGAGPTLEDLERIGGDTRRVDAIQRNCTAQ